MKKEESLVLVGGTPAVVGRALGRSFEAAIGDLWGRLDSPASRRGYQTDWRLYCEWLAAQGMDPREADAAVVQRYVNELRDTGKAKATRARALSVLREVYRTLVVGKFCASNPAREVKNPKVSKDPRTPWMDGEGLRHFFSVVEGDSWVEGRNRAMVLALIFLGARRSEIARLRVEDITGGSVWLTVKRDKKVLIGIPPYLLREIQAWLARAGIKKGAIFPRSPKNPEPVSDKMLYDAVKDVARRAGNEKMSPHSIRRSFITILRREKGVDIRDLQLVVSHESVTTTERYEKTSKAAHLIPGELLRDLVERKK